MNLAEREFLERATLAAENAGHIFARAAACEAALESGYGKSQLAAKDNNLFGMKQHTHPIYGTKTLPTRECIKGEWIPCSANWVVYPDWQTCFQDRMATLRRLSTLYAHYAAALLAQDSATYIAEVSKTWSTDPNRGAKVQQIFDDYNSAPTTGLA